MKCVAVLLLVCGVAQVQPTVRYSGGGRRPSTSGFPVGGSAVGGLSAVRPHGTINFPHGGRRPGGVVGVGGTFPGAGVGVGGTFPGAGVGVGGTFPGAGVGVGGTFPGAGVGVGGTFPGVGVGGKFPGAGVGGQFPGAGVGGQFPGAGVGGLTGGHVGGGAGLPPIGVPDHEPVSTAYCTSHNAVVHAEFPGSGSFYHFSWCNTGGAKYEWGPANAYCKSLGHGWSGVAIDTPGENQFITNIIDQHRLPWIWTGARRQNTHDSWAWYLSGSQKLISKFYWGQTGSERIPQPDNIEDSDEKCLAILNRFYPGDGITWHDIKCNHVKPIICETRSRPHGYTG